MKKLFEKQYFKISNILFGKAGFTLIEALISVAILTIALTGPMTIAQTGLSASIHARDSLTAALLATEAVEYIRNIRDTGHIGGSTWPVIRNRIRINNNNNPVRVDVYRDVIDKCSGQECRLNFNKDLGIYSYASGQGWEPSRFTRRIEVSGSGQIIIIDVEVDWEYAGVTKTYAVREYFYNLKYNP